MEEVLTKDQRKKEINKLLGKEGRMSSDTAWHKTSESLDGAVF